MISGLLYRIAYKIWWALPYDWREYVYHSAPLMKLRDGVRNVLAAGARREDIYNEDYYKNIDGWASRSAPTIVASAINTFSPKSVVDGGCGSGAILDAFNTAGCLTFGLEYSEAGLAMCRKRSLNVEKFDIEKDTPKLASKADLALCTEVAERIDDRFSDKLVDVLCAFSDTIIFTAAPPGQGGADHVNEQPPEHWINKFDARGYSCESRLADQWKASWKEGGVAGFYFMNLMIFARKL
jgi:hypothetical protein